jgi:hypothetical protein
VTTKAELLNYPLVGGPEGTEHKADLQSRINSNAPHFEPGKHTGESGFKRNDRFVLCLFDVNEIKNVTELVNRARGIKILINVLDHFKSLAIKL